MSCKPFTVSAALCLALAFGPVTVLSVPQMGQGALPLSADDINPSSDSETAGGLNYNIGIPGGPSFEFGAGFQQKSHDESCDSDPSQQLDAGMGYGAGIPDGPSAGFGAGVHHVHRGASCAPAQVTKEIVETTTVTAPGTTNLVVVTSTAEVVEVPSITEAPVQPSLPESILAPSSTLEVVDTASSEITSSIKTTALPVVSAGAGAQANPTETSASKININVPVTFIKPPTDLTTASLATAIAIPIPLYTPTAQVPMHSTPLVQHMAPTGTPKSQTYFNAAAGSCRPHALLRGGRLALVLGVVYPFL
ncbi:Uncharacterized protein PECH_008664 [Penicillium ucsense]|uniref:Uncharacterized protein n=1 Tax=Penicillium ucsense TaxID=2839758 RepID=A0A8J8W369_9EURO|nr:Uncharacterized protein PECM_005239 [Penicillium ucsense]KAF7738669.1 Uncharacterized protein PECH_008664 [Penicillium ucsense]